MGMAALIRYNAACKALAAAHRLDEVKDIKDKAEALRQYGIQANNGKMVAMAREIKMRATRRIGELSKALDKGKAGRPKNRGKNTPQLTKKKQLENAGISKRDAARAEKLADEPKAEFESRFRLHHRSETPEHYTPDNVLELVFQLFTEDFLDPCADPDRVNPCGIRERRGQTLAHSSMLCIDFPGGPDPQVGAGRATKCHATIMRRPHTWYI
jgi:hypothetical protein